MFYQNLVLLAFLPDWDGIRVARAKRKRVTREVALPEGGRR